MVQVGAGLQEWDAGCWALPVLLSKPEHHCCRLLLDPPGSSLSWCTLQTVTPIFIKQY